jgi:hypothetical protein
LGLSIAAAFGVATQAVHSQSEQPVVRIIAPEDPVSVDTEELEVKVEVDGVENLGAFSFAVSYDPDVVEARDIQRGSFLGTSGREVNCNPPNFQSGEARLTCVTLRPDPPQGAEGSGELGTVFFNVVGEGESPLTLSVVELTTPIGEEIVSTSVDANVTVESSGSTQWWLWAIGGVVVVAVVVGVVFALSRLRRRSSMSSA